MNKFSSSSRTARITNPSSKNPSSTKRTMPRIAVIILGIILVVLFFMAMGGRLMKTGEPNGEMSAEQKKMEAYLEEKYGQEFVVEETYKNGSGLGVIGAIHGKAHPTDNPTIKFEIRRPENESKYEYDTYVESLWSSQGRAEIDAFIKDKLPPIDDYILKIEPINHFSIKRGERAPSFQEVRQASPDKFSYNLIIRSTASTTDNEPSQQQLENVMKLITFIKNTRSTSAELYYLYKDPTYNKFDHDQKLYQYRFMIKEGSIAKINSIEDLKAYFERIAQ